MPLLALFSYLSDSFIVPRQSLRVFVTQAVQWLSRLIVILLMERPGLYLRPVLVGLVMRSVEQESPPPAPVLQFHVSLCFQMLPTNAYHRLPVILATDSAFE